VSDLSRSLVISLLVLIWFFVVPVPGLFVFRAEEYRLSISLAGILISLACIIGAILVSAWLGECIQWLDWHRPGRGLKRRFQESWRRFHELTQSGEEFSTAETASVYALFTQAQTYLDQRSYAYVRQTLDLIQEKLAQKNLIQVNFKGAEEDSGNALPKAA
jgi:hypothetical protein